MSQSKNNKTEYNHTHPYEKPYADVEITAKNIENIFSDCGDFQKREIYIALRPVPGVTALWLDGVVDGDTVTEAIIRPLTQKIRMEGARTSRQCVDLMLHGAVYANTVQKRDRALDVVDDLCHGWCAVIFDDINEAVTFEVRTANVRSISSPTLEKSVKGAKDAFVETLRINTSLVRRRLCTPKLKVINTRVGRKSSTRCAILYIEGVADSEIVSQLAKRLDKIDVDGLLASSGIEDYIVDCPLSPFPQTIHTERPDRFAQQILGGRIGLIVNGIPLGFLVPATLSEFMRVPQDKTNNFIVASTLSVMRWLALFMSLALPAILVAISMYHQEMIPTKLLVSLVQAKQSVPFSVAFEVISMLLAFDLLQEAGLRLPNPVGDTVSIIGALIVGQSAVEARVVSPVAVIIVALAGICGYTLPSQDMSAALRVCRIVLVILALASGLFGVAAGICMLCFYLCGIESFGVNYMSPLSSGRKNGIFRALLRTPERKNKYRDPDLKTPDKRKQA